MRVILRCKRCKKNTFHYVTSGDELFCGECDRRHGITGIVKYFEGEVIEDVDEEADKENSLQDE